MSKKLTRAIAEGRVVVVNKTAGEVMVWLQGADGNRKTITVAPFGKRELAPRYTSATSLRTASNLPTLLRRSLRIE